MNLSVFPRVRLGSWPTPLEECPRLSAALGGPHLWVKRDDLTGLGLGGNKVRKLEYLLGEAIRQGADAVVTTGGPQSNHARLTAAACRRLGLDVTLVLSGFSGALTAFQGNLLLDHVFGAEIVHLEENSEEAVEEAVTRAVTALTRRGRHPYAIPLGGSSGTGTLGYVAAALEIAAQATAEGVSFEHVFVTTGSGGTHAGLHLGLAHYLPGTQVHGVTISHEAAVSLARVEAIAGETAFLLGLDAGAIPRPVVHGGYVGDGYAVPTPGGWEAILLAARTEGLVLDPVYTGKALAGLIDLVREDFFPATSKLLAQERCIVREYYRFNLLMPTFSGEKIHESGFNHRSALVHIITSASSVAERYDKYSKRLGHKLNVVARFHFAASEDPAEHPLMRHNAFSNFPVNRTCIAMTFFSYLRDFEIDLADKESVQNANLAQVHPPYR